MGKKPPKDGYEVGYSKPPKHTQFQPGQSGNPSGKKKGTPDLQTMIQAIGAEPITVIEGGAKKQIPKSAAVVQALYVKAMKGDVPAGRLLLATLANAVTAAEADVGQKLSDADLSTLKRHADWVKLLEEAAADEKEADNDQGS
ncbi:DUF5681 domain-containing protein [Oceanibium sediminis]|uniref:DUF5681 domain-containing protein n=1 Tax=Oceanibium sediminis TaxID=2026339 RepID=UPI000DD2CBAD|nr:DUF5681 domain-containing protein [Oceanibium sediminis]